MPMCKQISRAFSYDSQYRLGHVLCELPLTAVPLQHRRSRTAPRGDDKFTLLYFTCAIWRQLIVLESAASGQCPRKREHVDRLLVFSVWPCVRWVLSASQMSTLPYRWQRLTAAPDDGAEPRHGSSARSWSRNKQLRPRRWRRLRLRPPSAPFLPSSCFAVPAV